MGFFDSLKKVADSAGESLKNSVITNLEKNWKDMEKLGDDRLKEIYKDRGAEHTMGYVALLKLASRGQLYGINFDHNTKETLTNKAAHTKRTIELEDSYVFDDIRNAVEALLKKVK
jgi:hypothetical protein